LIVLPKFGPEAVVSDDAMSVETRVNKVNVDSVLTLTKTLTAGSPHQHTIFYVSELCGLCSLLQKDHS
jgi:hypothetical protein